MKAVLANKGDHRAILVHMAVRAASCAACSGYCELCTVADMYMYTCGHPSAVAAATPLTAVQQHQH
jgi:hypothetical protein